MKALFLLGLITVSATAEANLPKEGAKGGIGLETLTGTDDYRLGDEWGKRPVTAQDLPKATPAFRRAALATARLGGGTGFYLGKFGGAHVVATNHHVMPSEWSCRGGTVARFPLLGAAGTCERMLGTWPEIDLALITVRVSAADEAKLAPVAGNFQFQRDVEAGETLLTVGFGVAGNDFRAPMANQDSDCYVFSKTGEYRQMADPDEYNPGDYRAWSFALGCDVSHGDSGSAIVDRESGAVVGIIWTGRIPKSASAQSSASLARMFQEQSEDVWRELSYAVPARKIGEHLRAQLNGGMPEENKAILRELLR